MKHSSHTALVFSYYLKLFSKLLLFNLLINGCTFFWKHPLEFFTGYTVLYSYSIIIIKVSDKDFKYFSMKHSHNDFSKL